MSSAPVGVVAVSSPAFVTAVLERLDRGVVTAPLRHRDDRPRIDAAGVGDVVVPEAGAGWLDVRHRPRDDEATAQILFTSGTEGEPKGVVLSHRALAPREPIKQGRCVISEQCTTERRDRQLAARQSVAEHTEH